MIKGRKNSGQGMPIIWNTPCTAFKYLSELERKKKELFFIHLYGAIIITVKNYSDIMMIGRYI